MDYVTVEEIELALAWWEEEERKARLEFLGSLTPAQRDLLRRYYMAARKKLKMRRWLREARAGRLKKRILQVPDWAKRDYAFMRLARKLGLGLEAGWALQEALRRISDVERKVLEVCFGLDGSKPKSLSQATYSLGLPKETVNIVMKRALEQIYKLAKAEK